MPEFIEIKAACDPVIREVMDTDYEDVTVNLAKVQVFSFSPHDGEYYIIISNREWIIHPSDVERFSAVIKSYVISHA